MGPYLLRRFVHTFLVVLGVITLVFVLIRLSGDPASLYMPEDATPAEIEAYRERMGWNKPIYEQFGIYIWRLLHADFGMSLRHNEPALGLILERVPATLELTGVAFFFALIVAIPVGVLSGVRRNSLLDSVARVFALVGQCMPNFWLGILLILFFAVKMHWLPAYGRGDVKNLILPGATLGLSMVATTMRLLRSSVLDVLGEDHVRTARAKGLREGSVVMHHVLKNAAIPVITVIGLELGALLSGSIITETVFAYPGMGRLAVQAIAMRDFPVVQAFVAVSAVIYAVANLAVDLLYTVVDPRIRL
jgi:peptide/nickel transport system permease protein